MAGWLGAEVLDGIRLTIDYRGLVSYWQRKRPAAPSAIAQVGVTLQRRGGGSYAIGGNVVRNGRPTADGIETGDRLIAVDRRHVAGLPSEEVMQALSASPGMLHWLTLERGDRIMKMNAP